MKVPYVDLSTQYKQIKNLFFQRIDKVCRNSNFILGEEVTRFEKEFADYCGVKYAVGLNSGTDALFLSLLSLGIGKGDEVIVPSFTFIATALAVSHTQAKPVFVDIDENTYNIDVCRLEKAVTKRTRAIVPVHLFGHPADMSSILRIADKYGLKVIEDAAQAHGAEYRNLNVKAGTVKKTGSLGDIGCFSFYPTKNLGGFGDGGMTVTNSKKNFARLKMLRDSGRVSQYLHFIKGYNSRLDTLQAVILRLRLKNLDKFNQLRYRNAKIYTDLMKGHPGIICPYEAPFVKHVYHVYALQVKNRDNVRAYLQKNYISTLIHYPVPLHLQRAYKDLDCRRKDFPVSEKIARRIISLPMHPFLKLQEIQYVARHILKAAA